MVPKGSEFFGISIYMYFRDHAPPHFHARHGGAEVLVRVEDLSVMEGGLPPRALGFGHGVGQSTPDGAGGSVEPGAGARSARKDRSSELRAEMLYRIEQAKARPNYRLWVRFSDGTEGEVELSGLVGKGVFAAWRDQSVFNSVSVDSESGTVTWPGDIDLAPDALYKDISSVPT